MIAIDSDVLRSVKASAACAVDEMTSGVEKLHSVTTHDDWNCAERDMINDRILDARKNMDALYERTKIYLEVVQKTADRFDFCDMAITKAFQNVHGMLSESLSVTTPYVKKTTSVIQGIKDAIINKVVWMDKKDYNVLSSIDKPISVCRYSDVDFGK